MRNRDGEVDKLNVMFKSGENVPRQEQLEEFSEYDASYYSELIDSTHPDSEKKFVRAASFTQLSMLIYDMLENGEINDSLKEDCNEFLNHVFYDMNGRKTEKSDIQKAVDLLRKLGIDVKKLEDGLKTWPNE